MRLILIVIVYITLIFNYLIRDEIKTDLIMSELPQNDLELLKQLLNAKDHPRNISDLDSLLQQITWKIGWDFKGSNFKVDYSGKKAYLKTLAEKILREKPLIIDKRIKRTIVKRDWWWFNLRYSDIDKKYGLKPF